MSLQASIFGLISRRHLEPDVARHVAVDGAALDQLDDSHSSGLQADGAYAMGDRHVLRAGLFATAEHLDRDSRLFRVTPGSATTRRLGRDALSAFAQDEWKLNPTLTANLGARGDVIGHIDGVFHLQPRASIVWQPTDDLTLHAGYARSVAAAPLEDSGSQFVGAQTVERSDLVDAGPQWHSGLTLGLEGYVRWARNLFATAYRSDAPFGDAFSFAHARLYGIEAVATYTAGPVSAWTNVAVTRATGVGISAGQGLLASTVAAYVATHRVPLDTDQRVTASAGASLKLDELLLSGDLVAGTGTPRTLVGAAPNSALNPGYVTGDVAAVYHVRLIKGLSTDLRVDVRNVASRRVALSDGTGIGRGAVGWSEPRGIYAGIEQAF